MSEPCGMPHPAYPERLCDRPMGHDAHRRNGDAWATDSEAWDQLVAERDALRERIADESRLRILAETAQANAEIEREKALERLDRVTAELDSGWTNTDLIRKALDGEDG